MPYVIRGANREVAQVRDDPSDGAMEYLEPESPEIRHFIDRSVRQEELRKNLASTDAGMIRVIDDVIEILLKKGVIGPSDLPEFVMAKVRSRQQARGLLREMPLVPDDDVI